MDAVPDRPDHPLGGGARRHRDHRRQDHARLRRSTRSCSSRRILWHALPFIIQFAFLLFFTVAQFALLFWFLSRGGVDVYYPGDVKTRFSDVWGQDHVLERVKENIIFLEDPELIEDRGGYVPGGILLWGPPGTGKTLIAEAVAGETGNPFVFVDPGAFINMFMGVGILKVKSLFRKLRKLALRYGGVIVFFDEADSLGNRGIAMGGAPGGGPTRRDPGAVRHGRLPRLLLPVVRHPVADRPATRCARSSQPTSAEPGAPAEQADRRRHDGRRHGRRRHGHAAVAAVRAVRAEEAARVHQPGGAAGARHAAEAAAAVPDPDHDGDQHADRRSTRRCCGPGRIDRIYKVGYPSKAGRIRTYEGYFAKVAHKLTDEQIDRLATITPYATGATIKDLVNESLIIAIRDGRDVITWPT